MGAAGGVTPEVRASHLKTLVAVLPAFGDERAARVRAGISPGALDRIERSPRLAWLPAQLLVDLCEAARAVVGDADLEEWGQAALAGVMRAPLSRAFFEAAWAFHRRNPAVVLSYVTQAWRLLYTGCGELELTSIEPGTVRVLHAPVPELLRRTATVLPLVGSLGAIPALCGHPGRATAEWSPGSPRFVYTVRWSPDAPPPP